jgi:transcriptional regulator with XRE-family HTH domain
MDHDIPGHLAANLKQLRVARGLTQSQIAQQAGIPRATWAHLETGSANPTLTVLTRAAMALRVSIEELLAGPRNVGRFYPAGSLPLRTPNRARIQRLLPDPIPGVELERIELATGIRFVGTPHTAGTREYLTCESGSIDLAVGGESWTLAPGDVIAFRGDQRHSYHNPGEATAVGYSVVSQAPPAP